MNNKLHFIIEAKRNNKKITDKHRKQVINYGELKKVPFVIITNGNIFEMINIYNSKQIKINNEVAMWMSGEYSCRSLYLKNP